MNTPSVKVPQFAISSAMVNKAGLRKMDVSALMSKAFHFGSGLLLTGR